MTRNQKNPRFRRTWFSVFAYIWLLAQSEGRERLEGAANDVMDKPDSLQLKKLMRKSMQKKSKNAFFDMGVSKNPITKTQTKWKKTLLVQIDREDLGV